MTYEISESRFEQMIRNETAMNSIQQYLDACRECGTKPTVESVLAILRGCGYDTRRTGNHA